VIDKRRGNMNKKKLAIVLSTQMAEFNAVAFKGDLEANLEKISRMGYAGVELAIRDPAAIDLSSLEKLLERNALRVPALGTGQAWSEDKLSLSSPDGGTRKAAIARIKDHIRLAEQLGAQVIIGLIRGRTQAGQQARDSINYLVTSLKECTSAAAEAGVRLVIEPINRYETDLIPTAADAVELIGRVGASNLGLLLDTFHMNIEEDRIEDTIHKYGKQIDHFHVADSNRWYPGAGHLDFHSILQALQSTGYQGWISGEFLPYPDPDAAALQNITYLASL
jgi:5-keto-L-gluconate epimerase